MPELNIEKTKKLLGPVIKKPPLSEKLLSKPPYRYLYDVITEVNKATGFFEGLFSDEEIAPPGKETSKEIKLSFLQKVIDVLELVTNTSISAKPSKIIAGHEPEKTNEMLQALGQALQDKLDSKPAIKKLTGGGKDSKKTKEEKKTSDSAEKEEPKARDSSEKSKHKKREQPNDNEKPAENGHTEKEDDQKRSSSGKSKEKSHKSRSRHDKEKESSNNNQDRNTQEADAANNEHVDDNNDGSAPPNKITRPSSAKGHRRRQVHGDSDGAEESEPNPATQPAHVNGEHSSEKKVSPVEDTEITNEQPPSQAPPAPAPSKSQSHSEAPQPASGVVQSSAARPASSRPAAPRKRNPLVSTPAVEKPVILGAQNDDSNPSHIFFDKGNKDDSSDDDDDVVITQTGGVNGNFGNIDGDQLDGNNEEHGGLVQKILETKKKEESQKSNVKVDKSVISATSSKEQEAIAKRTKALQEKLQSLVKSAAPLKQIMNYVQEDIDGMCKELTQWNDMISKNTAQLQAEKQKTDRELSPLLNNLEHLDNELAETTELIRNKKASIIQNEQLMHKMLSRVGNRSAPSGAASSTVN